MTKEEGLFAWYRCCTEGFYGAMVVMKILFFGCGWECVNDVLAWRASAAWGK